MDLAQFRTLDFSTNLKKKICVLELNLKALKSSGHLGSDRTLLCDLHMVFMVPGKILNS